MTVKVFKSSDAGAPAMPVATQGALITVLDYCLVTGCGWTRVSGSTSTLAAYQMPGTKPFCIRVDDAYQGNNYAVARSYESMSGVSTGINASSEYYILKGDAGARDWMLVCNGTTFYLHINNDNTVASTSGNVIAFGLFNSFRQNDVGNCIICLNANNTTGGLMFQELTAFGTTSASKILTRPYTQVQSVVAAGFMTDGGKSGAATKMGAGGMPYPNPVDMGAYMAPISIHEAGSVIRGELPGIWCPMHNRPLGHNDTFEGTGAMAGKTFHVWNTVSGGQVFVEISDTW